MSPPIAELKAAMATEVLALRAGTMLFVWQDELYTLRPKKHSPHLRDLCDRYYKSIVWLLEARASE